MTNTNTPRLTWKSEAGPRQTKEVEKALQTLRYAGQGVKVLSTWTDGSEHESTETTMFSPTPEEEAHKLERIKQHNQLHTLHGGLITRENFRQVIADTLPIIETLKALQPVRDERRTPEKIAADNAERIERAKAQNERHRIEEEERAAAAEELAKEYPYLKRADKHGGGVEAAKNIRLVLKREFPGIKFSVKSSYSSVNVNWTDGPTVEAVDSKISNFKAGSFDGMTDCYNYNRDAFNDAFGSAEYLFTSRNYRDGLKERVLEAVEAPSNCEGWELQQYKDREVHKALAAADLTGKGDFTGLHFDYEEQRYILDFKETAKAPAKTPTAYGNTSGQTYTIEEHTHTKKEKQYFLCIAADRMEREDFNAERDRAKDCGGWYSRAWQGTPGGFAFWTEAEAQAFVMQGGGETPDGGPKRDRNGAFKVEGCLSVNGTPGGFDYNGQAAKASKLRTMADKLEIQIADKRAPGTQNMTPKRSLERRHRLIDADLLERVQTALYAVADGLQAGTYTGKVPTKTDLMKYLRTQLDTSRGMYEIADTGEYSNTSPEAVKIQTLLSSAKTPEQEAEEQERKTAQLIESKILNLAGAKIPGFFVTHKETAARVMYEADIQPGETVLEPSAGTGNLADLAREAGGVVQCVEIRPALCEILRLKGHTVECDDFLDYMVDYPQDKFDKIVMNPPFEKGHDGQHVTHAYNFLKEGGRLVAIMSEGTFFRSDLKATCFRGWLDSVGGVSEKLPEGSFAGGGEVNRTGTATRIVIINK